MKALELIDVTSENWKEVCRLDSGTYFVAPNAYSLAQSFFEKGWTAKAICAEGKIIGFTMYGFAEDLKIYEICRFMIDKSCQGKGFGKKALNMIVDRMRETFECKKIYLCTSPKNERGKHIYTSFGFVPTGEVWGEGEHAEMVYCLEERGVQR